MLRTAFLSLVGLLALSATTFAAPIYTFTANINGPSEVPPTTSPAFGTGLFTYDVATDDFSWNILYTDILLSGPETGAHIHQEAPASNVGPIIIPLALGSSKTGTVKLGSVAGASLASLVTNEWYVNIHTAANPGGEIRGQIVGVIVPEPSAIVAALALGGVGLVALRRRS